MRIKKPLIILGAVAVILTSLALIINATNITMYEQLGIFYRDASKSDDNFVAAEYNGEKLLMSAIEYERNVSKDENLSDREIAQRLIGNTILYEEAVKRGFAATQEEINAMVASTKEVYEIPDGKIFLDEYCRGAGITLEEYFDDIESQAPRVIARQKLKDEIGREYCEANGLEFTKVNPPQEMMDAIQEYIAKLVEENQDKVTYYVK